MIAIQINELDAQLNVALKDIIEYCISSAAIDKEDQWITIKGKRHKRKSTAGWKFLCLMRADERKWLPLSL